MTVRYYSSSAGKMVLQLGVTAVATAIQVDTTAGLPGTTPFTLLIDVGQPTEEIVTVTQVSGNTLVVTRGEDGTSAQAHANGAVVRHAISARDLRDSRDHENAAGGVHGILGNVVGTSDVQTVTNKNLTSATNTFPATLATTAGVTTAVATEATARTAADAAHAALTTAHGVAGAVVGTTDTQTLTGKTIDGANNTLVVPQAQVTGLVGALAVSDSRTTALETGPSWTAITGLATGATADAPAPPQRRAWPLGGRVELRGIIHASTTFAGGGVVICTLPAGSRPGRPVHVNPCRNFSASNTSDIRLTIDVNGDVVLYTVAGETQWFSLDGIFYYTS